MSKTEVQHEIMARREEIRRIAREEFERQVNSDEFKAWLRQATASVSYDHPPFTCVGGSSDRRED